MGLGRFDFFGLGTKWTQVGRVDLVKDEMTNFPPTPPLARQNSTINVLESYLPCVPVEMAVLDSVKPFFRLHYATNLLLAVLFFILKTTPIVCDALFQDCKLELVRYM